MKKVFLGLSLTLLGLLLTIILLSKNRKILDEELFFTIPQIYTYQQSEKKEMSFTIYSNRPKSLISFPEKNTYYLLVLENRYQLMDVKILQNKNCIMNKEDFYSYTISSPLLKISSSDNIWTDCKLLIQNDQYSLECDLGDISIYNVAYPALDFSDLYGNYAYYEQELHFIGFTIALNPKYKNLEDVCIGKAYTPLDSIEKDKLYDSERELSNLGYPLVSKKNTFSSYSLTAQNNYYYIPVAYESLMLIKEAAILIKIDGTIYALPNFIYLANDILLKDYPNRKVSGVCKYD